MKKLVLILLIFAPAILSAANKEWKEGYIVTISNDTIKGYIAYRNSMADQKNCLFKSSPDSQEIVYTPQQLFSYRYNDGLYFQSKNVNAPHLKGKYFIECLLEGFINLYSTQIQYSKNIENKVSMSPEVSAYLVEMPGDDYWMEMINPGDMYNNSLQSLKNDKKLESLFSDKIEDLKNDIPKASYSRDKMTALFKKYHDLVCTDRECIVYKEIRKAPAQFLTYYASFGFQKRTATENLAPDQERFLCPVIHLGAAYSRGLSKFTDRLRLNVLLDLFYLNAKKSTYYEGIVVNPGYVIIKENGEKVEGPRTYDDLQFRYQFQSLGVYNQISLEGRLMSNKKIQPLLEIGIYQQAYIPVKNKIDTYIGESLRSSHSMDYPHYIAGVVAAVGISINRKGYQIPIKINGNLPFTGKSDRVMELGNQFNLSIGYTFSIGKNKK